MSEIRDLAIFLEGWVCGIQDYVLDDDIFYFKAVEMLKINCKDDNIIKKAFDSVFVYGGESQWIYNIETKLAEKVPYEVCCGPPSDTESESDSEGLNNFLNTHDPEGLGFRLIFDNEPSYLFYNTRMRPYTTIEPYNIFN